MRMTVFGTGYLGATHAACMAELGHEVLGVDVDRAKIDRLRRGGGAGGAGGAAGGLRPAGGAGRVAVAARPRALAYWW